MVQRDESALNIYTDGSSLSSPRVGGAGLRFIAVDSNGLEEFHDEFLPAWAGATNNQMELQAPIEALKILLGTRPPFELTRFSKVVFYTDSKYLSENFNQAKFVWPTTRWRTRSGAPVLNAEQWKELIRLVKRLGLKVEVRWVKGHKRDPHNKRVDKLAKESARSPAKRSLGPQRVRRKQSPEPVEIGSVRMEGQTTTIRIITDEYLRTQRTYRYMFEVVAVDSSYYQRVDYVFSDAMLGAGHTYQVRFNADRHNPRIEEVLAEALDEE